MRVLYDGAIFCVQPVGGVNRYISKLIDLAPEDVEPRLATNVVNPVNFPSNPRLRTFYFKRFWFRPGRLCFWLEKRYFRRVMLEAHYDAFHPSLYAENAAQVPLASFRCPVVVTVYDLIDEIHPEVDPTGLRRRQKQECYRVAAALICISRNTRADLLARHPEVEPKVHVIHMGCEMDTSAVESREGVPQVPYFLFVGTRRSAYKNFGGLLDAFASLARRHPSLHLVVAGSALTPTELERIAELGLNGRVQSVVNPPERMLARLYRWSVALVYPSLYEGFGIPPLEAMLCGTPVIAADRSSIPEVVGNAAVLFDPDQEGALKAAMEKLLICPDARQPFIEAGRERAKQYRWEDTVCKTMDVYRTVARTGG